HSGLPVSVVAPPDAVKGCPLWPRPKANNPIAVGLGQMASCRKLAEAQWSAQVVAAAEVLPSLQVRPLRARCRWPAQVADVEEAIRSTSCATFALNFAKWPGRANARPSI